MKTLLCIRDFLHRCFRILPGTAAKSPAIKPSLEYLDIELTERCNLCCTHCYIRRSLSDEARDNEMDTGFIKKLLDEAVSLGCKGVRFTGGEPLVRPDFQEIYLYAYGLNMKISVATNATLITDEVADMLAAHRPEAISTSLYGWDEKSYAKTVGRPCFFRDFFAGVRRISQHGIALKFKYPATKFLVDNSAKLQALAEEFGFKEELPHIWELTMHSRNGAQACQRIKACRMHPKEAAIQRLRDRKTAVRDRELLLSGRKKFTGWLFDCQGAAKRLCVDAYGRLQPCLEMRDPALTYDLTKGALKKAISSHMSNCRRMKFTSPVYLNRCGKCLLRPACPLCPACSWMECGNAQSPADYYCQVMHEEAKILGFLSDGEKGWEIKGFHQQEARC
jgi:MoaA/NifB/PqqE/SkfB family radical SAM enzyme